MVPIRSRLPSDELWTDGRGLILFALAFGWFLNLGVRFVFPALVPSMRSAIGLDVPTTGLLLTVLWIAYGAAQFPGGIIGDRLGDRNVLVMSMGLAAGSLLLLMTTATLPLLFVGTIGFGLATALYAPACFTIPAMIYERRSGTAMGLISAAGYGGSSLLPAAAGVVAVTFSWQLGFGYVVPLFVVSTLLLWSTIPRRTTATTDRSTESVRSIGTALVGELRKRSIVAITIILTVIYVVLQGFTGFYPTYLIDVKGFGPELAATFFGLFFASGVVFSMITGVINDRFSARYTLASIIVVTLVGLAALPVANGLVPLFLATVALSFILSTMPVAQTYLANVLSEEVKGSGLGMLRSVYVILGSIGPYFVAQVATRHSFDVAFLALAAIGLLGLAGCYFIADQ